MKHITVIGGNGAIGTTVTDGLRKQGYDVTVLDIRTVDPNDIQCDASDYQALKAAVPEDLDAIVFLAGVPVNSLSLVLPEDFDRVSDGYFKSVYNTLYLAWKRRIPRVVLASSHHAADVYEDAGASILGRPIRADDYPYSVGLYGVLKTAGENLAYAFHRMYGVSVISLRIGVFRANEQDILTQPRFRTSWISKTDTVDVFIKAVETPQAFGTYYAVSDNPGRPWEIESTIQDIGYAPSENAEQVIRRLGGGQAE